MPEIKESRVPGDRILSYTPAVQPSLIPRPEEERERSPVAVTGIRGILHRSC